MECEILGDGRTVWVNASDGSNIARFGRMGIDVHTTITDQMAGASQCLACSPGPTGFADWREFQRLVSLHYGVRVDDTYMPKFVQCLQKDKRC